MFFIVAALFSLDVFPEQQENETLPEARKLDIDRLQVLGVEMVRTNEQSIGVVAELFNPNNEWGAESIRYTFLLTDSQGNTLNEVSGESFILPRQKKFVVAPAIPETERDLDVQLNIEKIVWRKLADFIDLDLGVENVTVGGTTRPGFAARVRAEIINRSVFGLENVEVVSVLTGSGQVPVAVNRTNLQALVQGERRGVEMFWREQLPPVEGVTVEAYSNVFENSNFIREFGTEERAEDVFEGSSDDGGFQFPRFFERFGL